VEAANARHQYDLKKIVKNRLAFITGFDVR